MKRRRTFAGERLAYLREERWMSQPDLAERAGISKNAVWRLESGRTPHPHTSTVIQIARALDVHPDELVEQADLGDGFSSVRSFPASFLGVKRDNLRDTSSYSSDAARQVGEVSEDPRAASG